ncbi:unnamed protein product [Clavelina lepadiformis]|uniref:Uncharacterized protein n=1 Tax=Clavelina lepadiformis TaxID=159417 RepID=A0ABP0GZT0_CLALP
MNARRIASSSLLTVVCLLLCQAHLASSGPTRRLPQYVSSRGYVRKCGMNAKTFARSLCGDRFFDLPMEFNIYPLEAIIRARHPNPLTKPFLYQTYMCCTVGCEREAWTFMCNYHRVLRQCKSKKNETACRNDMNKDGAWMPPSYKDVLGL